MICVKSGFGSSWLRNLKPKKEKKSIYLPPPKHQLYTHTHTHTHTHSMHWLNRDRMTCRSHSCSEGGEGVQRLTDPWPLWSPSWQILWEKEYLLMRPKVLLPGVDSLSHVFLELSGSPSFSISLFWPCLKEALENIGLWAVDELLLPASCLKEVRHPDVFLHLEWSQSL